MKRRFPMCCGWPADYTHGGWTCDRCGHSVPGPPWPPLDIEDILERLAKIEDHVASVPAKDGKAICALRLVMQLDGSCDIHAATRHVRPAETPEESVLSRVFFRWTPWAAFESLAELETFVLEHPAPHAP